MNDEHDENYQSELRTIEHFVAEYRKKYDIIPRPGPHFEMSCIMYGEGYNLLYRQLVNLPNGTSYWNDLKDASIRSLVLSEIEKVESEKVEKKE